MNKLRNIAIAMLGMTVVLSIAGIAFAFYQMWLIALILLFGTILIGNLSVFFSARYMTWNARTSEQRAKIANEKLSAQLNELGKQQKKATEELHAGLTTVLDAQKGIQENHELLNEIQAAHETEFADLRKHVGTHARRTKQEVVSTVRASSRHVEALVHIYQRYPDVKLPMPSAGGWAIDAPALAHLLALIEDRQPRRILELGTGTSTIWVGYLCRILGAKLVTLDHLERYLDLTRIAIDRHQLSDVIDARLAPLESIESNGRSFNWYATDKLQDLSDIDMVIIDGPPAATGPQARYPALPQVLQYLTSDAIIVLDDAHRQDETEIVELWLTEYPEFREIERGTSGLAVLERGFQY